MPRHPSKLHGFWTPLLFFLLLVLGVFIGFQLNKHIGKKRPITTVITRNDRLEELISLINDRYVDSVSSDSLFQDAIAGILNHLDPHTVYIPAGEVAVAEAELKGEFKGIGIELFQVKDTLMVSKVVAGSPAEEAGLRLGDRIVAIDSTPVIDAHWDVDKLKELLSRKKEHKITVIRPGSYQEETLAVTQGAVPIKSVLAAYKVNATTGYIKLNRFSATTSREFNRSLKALKKQGIQQLILDLRGNTGGYVDAATAVADEFIGRHRLLVYTQGRATGREDYYADNNGLFEEGKLIVLVDMETASAAEILAGAIQDWDRGTLIGSRTFGKGLVQQQYELGDGSVLRLTIARYYTPSGRCIQRSYDKGKPAYMAAFLNRLYHPDSTFSILIDTSANQKKYYSMRKHRLLWGGGGIVPDIITARDIPYSEEDMLKLTSGKAIKKAVFRYYIGHYTALSRFHTAAALAEGFAVPDELMNRLKADMDTVYPKAVYILWQNPFALDFLRLQMKAEMIRLMFGDNDCYAFLNQKDTDVLKAERVLDAAAPN